MRYVVALACIIGCMTCVAQARHGAGAEDLYEGYWVLMFAVAPGCPACEDAIAWLGRAADSHREINVLLLGPWLTDELEAAADEAQLPVAVDDGGFLGAGLGVERAPALVCLLDREPLARLDWPFREDDLVQSIEELAATPRGGPWQHLGTTAFLGTSATLDGEPVDLDHIPGPWLLSFFSFACPACREELPALVALSEEIQVVVALTASHALSVRDTEVLRQGGLRAVSDEEGELAERLAVRATPTHVLTDPEGRICWVQEGLLRAEELRNAILVALGRDAEDTSEQRGGSG